MTARILPSRRNCWRCSNGTARAPLFSWWAVGRGRCPELVREIAARGHEIGNHTETHPNLALLSASRIEQELALCRESIAAALGVAPAPGITAPGIAEDTLQDRVANRAAWMRPPFGFRGPRLAGAVERAGLRGVAMWSLTCYDWKPQRPAALIERLGRVMGRASNAHGGPARRRDRPTARRRLPSALAPTASTCW